MTVKQILSIGFQLASDKAHYESFSSKVSVLDWDIVLFRPDIQGLVSYSEHYQGKPCLNDYNSFQLKECCEHWRRELKVAFDTGKTVIIFLAPLREVFVDSGRRTYSGTGRNQKTTVHVVPYTNYESIPATLSAVTANGQTMRFLADKTPVLSPYWSEFEAVSRYTVILQEPKIPACIVTRTGDKVVGAIFRNKASGGTMLLLPDIDFHSPNYIKERGDKQNWTQAARELAGKMVSTVANLDKALRASSEITPEPEWATHARFSFEREKALRIQLLEAESTVERAQKHKEQVREELLAAGAYRNLLFEKGKPLEHILIEALSQLGFSATPFRNANSEFDVVFESEEGRFIGEAEGKDNKAINIDKLRQLSMNVHEDLQREDVKFPAKAVLFGNGFRLAPIDERGDPFTEKCHIAATSNGTALVFTPDLFRVVQLLVNRPDVNYAKACRNALLSAAGRVTFPAPPDEPTAAPEPQIAETEASK